MSPALDWLIEPFETAIMQRALVAGVLAVVATGVVGTWVVLRGLAFMGDALAHGVLPGIALAFLLDINLTIGAAVGAAVMVAGIGVIHRRARLAEDTAIGLLFVGMLALGVIIVSRSGSFAVDLTSFLFGDILGTTAGDLWLQAIAGVIAVAGALLFYRTFLVLAFNEQKALVLGLHPVAAGFAMMSLITVAIVSSFQAVGTLLVFGLLVAPPATAVQLARRVPTIMAFAVGLGVVAVVAGLVISFHYDTAGGATISFTSVMMFFLVLACRGLIALRRRTVLADSA